MKEDPLILYDEEHAVSQRLIEGALSGDVLAVSEALANKVVDVNYKGPVNLRVKHTDSIQHEEAADEVTIEYESFKTDVTALFAAAHAGHICITKMLLLAGADVNEKLFKGYAVSAAAREGHHDVVDVLQRSGACQMAIEDALLEACLYQQLRSISILIGSEMIRPEVLVHALAHASNRGFVDVVKLLIENGVDINSWHRMLLRSAKPALHANVNCTPLIAAIIGRQVPVVNYLLEAGAKTGCKASLGAWSWEQGSLDEIRVGAGLASSYNELWCCVEYWEATGAILEILLQIFSSNDEHFGRTILCHAILCRNTSAVEMLLKNGADSEEGIRTRTGDEFPPVLMSVKYGCLPIVRALVAHGCDVNAAGPNGETALMSAAKLGFGECFEELLRSGADFGVADRDGRNALSIAEINGNGAVAAGAMWRFLRSGGSIQSSDLHVFSPLHFVARGGDAVVMARLLQQADAEVDSQDQYGYSALMVAAQARQSEVMKRLVHAGADIGVKNKKGETAICLANSSGCLEDLEKILLDAILSNVMKAHGFKPLHFAAWRGNAEGVKQLLKLGYSVTSSDEEGYTPLMLAAREGHAEACRALVNAGSDCLTVNDRGETALTLANSATTKAAEEVLLDHLAMKLVQTGAELMKHTREGKGSPHMKSVRMKPGGFLTWGNSSRRTVACKEAMMGATPTFRKNRKLSELQPPPPPPPPGGEDLFSVITSSGREVHFQGGNAELWVRGINLFAKEKGGAI